jgi:hypothetical protein
MTDFLTGSKRTVAAVSLALATAFTAGCAGMPRGVPTAGGAIGGAVIGNKVGGSVGAVLGGLGGAVLGSMAEEDCQTRVSGTQSRSVNGNRTGEWRGRETMKTDCVYSGNTRPGNFNAPQHLEHMQGGGTSNYRPQR